MSQHPALARLLTANTQWAQDVARAEPDFFETSAQGQKPQTLWIGCADSRVPETVITGARPGDIFVHRNIAKFVIQVYQVYSQLCALAVLKYSVDVLLVQNVVIVGHSNCGGAAACLSAAKTPTAAHEPVVTVPSLPADAPLNRWLAPLTRLVTSLDLANEPTVSALPMVVKENVKLQVENLCKTDIITNAWMDNRQVWVHGWVYDLATGKLEDLKISRGPSPAV